MEEMVTTEAIRKEILDDARKKAEHLLREADEEVAKAAAAGEEATKAQVEEIRRTGAQKAARFKAETLARIPLEKTRVKTAYVDRKVREAFDRFMEGLSEARVCELSALLLKDSEAYFKGKELLVRYKGISAKAAADVAARKFSGSKIGTPVEDATLGGSGIFIETSDGSVSVRATMDLIEERLLNRRRGELARALCAEALTL